MNSLNGSANISVLQLITFYRPASGESHERDGARLAPPGCSPTFTLCYLELGICLQSGPPFDKNRAGARWPSGLERWLGQATGLFRPGSNPTAEIFASELWQFRLPRFASVFRRRH